MPLGMVTGTETGMVTGMETGMVSVMVTQISLSEGFKTAGIQYGLTYKDYTVCMADGNL
jgi:hypothetical protein